MYEGFKDFKPEPLITSEVPAPKVKVGKSHQMELFENIKELKEEIALDKVEKSKKEPTPKEEPAPKEVESQLDLDRDVPPEPGLKDGELGLAGEVVSIRRFYDKDNRIHIIQKLDKNENQIGEAEYAPNTKEAQLAVKELKKLGYDTYMLFINTTLEVAQQRNAQRDRKLPEKLVKKIWTDVQKNMGKFQGLFKGNFKIIDNSDKRVAKRDERLFPKEFYSTLNKFIKAPVKSAIAKRWIKRQLELKKKTGM